MAVPAGSRREWAGLMQPPAPRESPLDRLRRLRDRWLSDPRLQRWAAALAPLRPIARARSRELFDLCAGFVHSQVLHACVALGLLQRLRQAPASPEELTFALAVPRERLDPLLDAAICLGLAERRGEGRVGLGTLGAALLGNPGVEAMIRHHPMLYADLADPAGFFRGTVPGRELRAFWGYSTAPDPARLDAPALAPYTELMAASQQFIAELVLAAYPFRRHRHLLDLGGGDGSFAAAVALRAPSLRIEMVDLPAVAARASERFRRLGLEAQASARGANLFTDALPRGADLVTLIRVAHDHDDHKVERLFRSAREAIAPGGTLLIAEPMSGVRSADAYLGVYLLAMGSGRTRSVAELGRMLGRAGFVGVRRRRTRNPLLASVVTARAPGGVANA